MRARAKKGGGKTSPHKFILVGKSLRQLCQVRGKTREVRNARRSFLRHGQLRKKCTSLFFLLALADSFSFPYCLANYLYTKQDLGYYTVTHPATFILIRGSLFKKVNRSWEDAAVTKQNGGWMECRLGAGSRISYRQRQFCTFSPSRWEDNFELLHMHACMDRGESFPCCTLASSHALVAPSPSLNKPQRRP